MVLSEVSVRTTNGPLSYLVQLSMFAYLVTREDMVINSKTSGSQTSLLKGYY